MFEFNFGLDGASYGIKSIKAKTEKKDNLLFVLFWKIITKGDMVGM